MDLSQLSCNACKGNVDKITTKEIKEFSRKIPKWELITVNKVDKLKRIFLFNNFQEAWMFANQVAAIAETENHHPEILLEWGRCTVTWWTHKSKGLQINDFICAAKIDLLLLEF